MSKKKKKESEIFMQYSLRESNQECQSNQISSSTNSRNMCKY
ncbi:unnamed protein product, partial [Brassica oleracea]